MAFAPFFCDNKSMKNSIDLSALSREELEKEYIKLHAEYESAMAKVNWYTEQYELSRARMFGRSSESGIAGQMSFEDLMLFNEAEALRDPIHIEPKVEDVIPAENQNKKHRGKPKKNISRLPLVTDVYELSPQEQICPTCGAPLHEMKEKVYVEIEVLPATVRVHKHITKVYACRNCDSNGSGTIIEAEGAPKPVIEKSLAGASLIADFMSKKYVDALPYYRQEKDYERLGIPVTRNNMCNWSIQVANLYFKPLIEKMRQVMYSDHVIHCDETTVEVLREPDRPASTTSYIWVTTTAETQAEHPAAIYNYTQSRSSTDARKVLSGYTGYIMCDGYAGYDALTKTGKNGEPPMDVQPVACMVHVRRKFVEALKVVEPKHREDTGANTAIKMLAELFHIDNQFSGLPKEEREKKRLEYLQGPFGDFFAWVKSEYDQTLPKSKYGQALEYTIKQEHKARRIFEDGRLELDNNLAERTVKPFVIGRKNWLFSNTSAGADASCMIYSIVESAKLNGLVPYEYIKYLLETMPGKRLTDEFIQSLMPWSKTIPGYVRKPIEE